LSRQTATVPYRFDSGQVITFSRNLKHANKTATYTVGCSNLESNAKELTPWSPAKRDDLPVIY